MIGKTKLTIQPKKVKKNWINLKFNTEGYYCDECMKVVSIFDEK